MASSTTYIIFAVNLAVFLSIFLLSACSITGQSVQAPKEYIVASILPLTGPGANFGLAYSQGLEQAIKEQNLAGSINGIPIKYVPQDSSLDPVKSVSAATYIVDQVHPDLTAVAFWLPAQAVRPILESSKTPWIYEAYASFPLNESAYGFKSNFDGVKGCRDLIRYAKGNHLYKRLGVIFAHAEYNQACLEGIKQVEPEVQEYWYTFGETDFRGLFSLAQNDGIDRLMTIGVEYESIAMFKQLGELGYPIKMMCATATECIGPSVIESSLPEVLENTLAADFVTMPFDKKSSWAIDHPSAGLSETAFALSGQEVGRIAVQALSSCPPSTASCIVHALETMRVDNSSFSQEGFPNHIRAMPTKLYVFKDGNWEPLVNVR